LQFSVYNFEMADVEKAWKHFELYERECQSLVEQFGRIRSLQKSVDKLSTGSSGLASDLQIAESQRNIKSWPVLAAYDLCLKCSHLFNILDARGAISVTERVGVIARVRALAVGIAKAWVDQQAFSLDNKEAVLDKRSAQALKGDGLKQLEEPRYVER
jgi:glycyl-tRNA synthetase alpha chain